jgi:two-component system, NtrC family, sensor histidine kinase HydH
LRLKRYVRPHDLVWIGSITALAIFGPDRSTETVTFIAGLGIIQILEQKFAFFETYRGQITAFLIKLVLCYFLIGWTDGIQSSYFWILLLPVVSAATALDLLSTSIVTVLAFGAYLSFYFFLGAEFVVPSDQVPELVLRVVMLLLVGFLTNQLAAARREQTRKYQVAAEQLEKAEATMRRSERLAALGQMSAGLAHELRNPLGTMKASAELLMRNVEPSNEVAHEMAGYISTEVDRTNSLITRFLDFARPLAVRLASTDLHEVLDRAVADIERHQPPLDVIIYKNYSPDIPQMPLDAELMERVIYNLLLNAAQASPPQGHITLKTRLSDSMVEIAVIDRGSGIDSKHLENIFNPFFTTKSNGVGLGLAIVSKIVDEHGGTITVESELGSGTVFHICLKLS